MTNTIDQSAAARGPSAYYSEMERACLSPPASNSVPEHPVFSPARELHGKQEFGAKASPHAVKIHRNNASRNFNTEPNSPIDDLISIATWPLRGALFLLGAMFGCSNSEKAPSQAKELTSSPPRPLNLEFDGRKIELPSNKFRLEEDLSGDPKLGKILFVRNLHAPPIGYPGMNPEARRPMELYQWQVLGLLELLRPRTIFLEEWKGNGGGKMVLEWIQEFGPLEPLLPRILELSKMPSVNGKPPAKEFSDLVGSLGAARLHTLRYVDEVELRRTLTPEELAQSERGLLTYLACANEKGPEKCQGIVQEYSKRREAWATREIIDHLRRHPGASVVLVFGAAHRFCDDFLRENFRPAISTLEINLEEFTEKRLVPPVQHCR